MNRLAVQFEAPYQVSVESSPLGPPAADQALVKTLVSAISPGTEGLIYRGEWPEGVPVDETIGALAGKFKYPLKYGYSLVGRVVEKGSSVPDEWADRLVFAFQPHQSAFLASPDDLIPLPEGMDPEAAALLPNMETAVSFLMDGRPMVGERVAVFGQGVVGLLTTALLSRMRLESLITLDKHPLRREISSQWGATATLDPSDPAASDRLRALLVQDEPDGGADLAYELSGNPKALDQAIRVTGFSGRVVVGSWYGAKRCDLDLGGSFHRGRVHILSSQVSRIAPELTGRWTKGRRMRWAIRTLMETDVSRLVTHRFHVSGADEAYRTLDRQQDRTVQILLTYEDTQ